MKSATERTYYLLRPPALFIAVLSHKQYAIKEKKCQEPVIAIIRMQSLKLPSMLTLSQNMTCNNCFNIQFSLPVILNI